MSSNRQSIHDSERTMRIGTPHPGAMAEVSRGLSVSDTPGKKQSVGLPESAGDLDRVGEFRDLQQIQGSQQRGCWFWPSAYLSSGMRGGGDGVDDPRDTATWFRSNLARRFKKRAFPARH